MRINGTRIIRGQVIRLLVFLPFYLFTVLLFPLSSTAQHFINLTADEVRIDSVLPCYRQAIPLGPHYADSVYEVSIVYPEFIEMSKADIARYHQITDAPLPEMPEVSQYIGVSRKEGTLYVSFVPLVLRDGKYCKLVSFQLSVKASALAQARHQKEVPPPSERYADHSVLASGQWAKIQVPETGIYHLTDAVIKQAGFSNPSKVRIYGYGGAVQPEKLTSDYLASTDDLKEVATCTIGGRRLFYGVGPVNWTSNTSLTRTRNPYYDYGCYFLTEATDDPLTIDSASFVSQYYPLPHHYHSIYEVDNYAWYHGGRNLYDSNLYTIGKSNTYTLPAYSTSGLLVVSMSYNGYCEAEVEVNDSVVGKIIVSKATVAAGKSYPDQYSVAAVDVWTFPVNGKLTASNKVVIRQTSGADMRLDYLTIVSEAPQKLESLLTGSVPAPSFVYRITNQDHHADPTADMVIIIPTTQKLLDQAVRLKTLHEQYDSMRVNIVPADELFNEFSSGTPDATAYRRYMKMLYDRAATPADQPRYLLLLGDGAWDNRMLSSNWRNTSPDDFLLCYESDNSFSETQCYVSDDYFCLLDDDEGGNMLTDKIDVAVGRLSARTSIQAQAMVDKIYAYYSNDNAGAWQNTLCFMGDDGDNNRHMKDAEAVVDVVRTNYSAFQIKKIYWDAYTRTTSSTGNSYPDVERLVKQQMQTGALVMNYSGHGSVYIMSHEQAIKRSYFAERTSMRLPLWVTASCDIMPFDGQEENIGEVAMYNDCGGAIAFFGTTRTVYASYNRPMNQQFMRYVLGSFGGERTSIGEAARLAKNAFASSTNVDMVINKQQFSLLGDPALKLALPTLSVVIDTVNGKPVNEGTQKLAAGSSVTVSGHIPGYDNFHGVATVTVFDVEQTIVGKMNDPYETPEPFSFRDRPNIVYTGSDSIANGRFRITFAVPKDISYSTDKGLLQVYAVNSDKTLEAHGEYADFTMGGGEETTNDGVGPSVYCYLNSESFVNGGTVNATPFFYARLTDKDGINASGNGIGHDLELIIDGEMNRTYNLNEYFSYDFGDFRNGTVGFSIPELEDGPHKLLFRAWDVLNNSTTSELAFNVNAKQEPSLISIICTNNPASSSTRFVIGHDRTGSQMDVTLEVYDTSGRKLWERSETGIPTDQTYVVDWDLTVGSGSKLRTGVYLYRVLVSSNGSTKASQAKKLIVL